MARPRKPSPRQRASYEERFDLGALFEFSTIINSSLDLTFILGHLLLTVMGKLLSLRGIVLLHKEGHSFAVETVRGLPGILVGQELSIGSVPDRLLSVDKEDLRERPWLKYFAQQEIATLVPLRARGKILGMAGFSASATQKRLGAKETTYLKSLANIAAGAIEKGLVVHELNLVNRRLDGKIQELKTLFEMSKEFNGVLNADQLIKLLLFSMMGQVGATRYIICLNQEGIARTLASRVDRELSRDVQSAMMKISSAVLVDELVKKHELSMRDQLRDAGIRALIPLQIQGQTQGALGLGDKMHGGSYSAADLEFLLSLGNLAMISLENVRLFKETLARQKLEDELIIAREIQRGLLPARLPEIPHFDVAATNISSTQVGGDYYDLIDLDGGRFMIAIGDVSGKGAPAALLMANLQATIRALIPLGLSLTELTKRVNDLMCSNTTSGRFITFFWGIIDAASRTFRYVSAGHNPPMLFRANGPVDRLGKGGLILGVMKSVVPYDEGEVKFDPGDSLVLFTDGVSEAMNTQGDELGEDQLEAVGRSFRGHSAQMLLTAIVDRVKAHSADTAQSDDITLLVLKATEKS